MVYKEKMATGHCFCETLLKYKMITEKYNLRFHGLCGAIPELQVHIKCATGLCTQILMNIVVPHIK